jgi:hypothetical protein
MDQLKRRKNVLTKRWKTMMEVNTDLKQKRTRIYHLSKDNNKQEDPMVEPKMHQVIIDKPDKVLATGFDPGVVSTAVMVSCTLKSQYGSINKYQTLAGLNIHSNSNMGDINTGV